MTMIPPPPPPRNRGLTALVTLLVAVTLTLPMAAQAQTTCPSTISQSSSCEQLRRCTHAEVAVKTLGNWRALENYRYCTQNKGSWSEQQWVDKCTQRGWKVAAHFYSFTQNTPAGAFPGFAIPDGVTHTTLETTPYCVAHKTNPSRYRLYFNGNGFVYEQQQCDQDRDNNGSYETVVMGDDNCSPVGITPTQVPKWVAPWD